MDIVGPRSLKGDSTSYYFFVLRDTFDLAVYLEFTDNRQMDTVLACLGRAWQPLGLPHQGQCDHGSACCGFGSSA
jgi:hypothetical protein